MFYLSFLFIIFFFLKTIFHRKFIFQLINEINHPYDNWNIIFNLENDNIFLNQLIQYLKGNFLIISIN